MARKRRKRRGGLWRARQAACVVAADVLLTVCVFLSGVVSRSASTCSSRAPLSLSSRVPLARLAAPLASLQPRCTCVRLARRPGSLDRRSR